jgi:hypothetical protein
VTVSRPGSLREGTEVRLGGQTFTVTAVTGTSVWLTGVTGNRVEVPLATVFSDPSLELVAQGPAPLPPAGALEVLDGDLVEQARWWEQHIVELLTGRLPDAGRVRRSSSTTTLR